ncbi:crossover junction endonuclease EME1 isoform X2 [Eurytemora carolleeae]|uniref:crossover junction endonuclease EME1 isoform X2 n=1 Tax=Eurytemora carolleeae TaxID=1294199 RepID=UPI000C78879D|nr:crossover junction endonuclease EME1 isoform X2 [Eurytemora carolleeae]|eukprot:XP_023335234.1 crossover junction endonuclease EME1-like isoform X2 [Eurytemora affinis]
MVYNYATYFKTDKNAQERMRKAAVRGENVNPRGWKECACNVFHQTRAVAEAPEKLKKSVSSSASFEFYAKAEGKDCISPKNLVEYWKQVLMQVTIISLEKASAITRVYPSPSSLIQAYRTCDSRKEAECLLANIEIRRLDTLVGGIRRIGDEISRKVYLALMSDDETSLLSNI